MGAFSGRRRGESSETTNKSVVKATCRIVILCAGRPENWRFVAGSEPVRVTASKCWFSPPAQCLLTMDARPFSTSVGQLSPGSLAQMVEHRIRNAEVTCSSHVGGTTTFQKFLEKSDRFDFQRICSPIPEFGVAGFDGHFSIDGEECL